MHIKVGRLVHRDESQHRGWQSGRASESSLCMYVHFDLQPYSSYFFVLFTFFLRRKWDVFHLIALSFFTQRYMGRLDRTLSHRGRERSRKALVINNINVRVSSHPWHSREPRLNRIRTRYIFGYAPSDFFNLLRSRSDFCISLRNHQS